MKVSHRKTASSGQSVSIARKLTEALHQFKILVANRNPFSPRDFSWLNRDLQEYRQIAKVFGGFDLDDKNIFEIGCGQRPYRLFWFRSLGLNANAVDLDKVIVRFSVKDFVNLYRNNGAERAAKTIFRFILFDLSENAKFRVELSRNHGDGFEWPIHAITMGDASDPSNWPDSKQDFVYSEDVFEHIPREFLPRLCKTLSQRLSDGGIAMIRPMVFTGIQGGHNVEYYDLNPKLNRVCPPWDHLRKHDFPANTYLNRMTLSDYRALFSAHFEILDEVAKDPEKGRVFMTTALRTELSDWEDEELFSNQVRFVLRLKKDFYRD